MQKISNDKKLAVLAEVPEVLRQLAAERDHFREKCAEYAHKEEVTKLAQAMIDKGLKEGKVEELAAELDKQASEGTVDLPRLRDAVGLLGPDMGGRIHISDDRHSGGVSALESFLLNG